MESDDVDFDEFSDDMLENDLGMMVDVLEGESV